MAHSYRLPRYQPGGRQPRLPRAGHPGPPAVTLAVLCAVAIAATACVSGHHPLAVGPLLPRTRVPRPAAAVLTGTPAEQAAETARELFSFAPVVVVTSASHGSVPDSAVRLARRAHAPLLLTWFRPGRAAGRAPAGGSAGAELRADIDSLHPRAVLAVGVPAGQLTARLPGLSVVTSPSLLPATRAPVPLHHVTLLLHRGAAPAAIAMTSTARLAGARVITVRGFDPRADPAAITALSTARPWHVLAAGAAFGPESRLAARLAVAATGVQLPGGGQVLFPGHRLVALYGHPGAPALGALGEQGLAASIARVRKLAARYRRLSRVPVVPAFEIIATVAQGPHDPEPDGSFSYQTPVSELRPWVRRATADGLYVVLDLQAGRASLLAQARQYRSLLRLPDVGLALDPEWKLGPGQLPLHQIGSVTISEVNSVVTWLARLTERYRLPQKLLVLHQFRLSMISGERRLDTRADDLAIVIHMDGQGTPAEKEQTWLSVLGAAPPGVFFGWKNFFVKDHPMLTPRQTMARTPKPVMISYQ